MIYFILNYSPVNYTNCENVKTIMNMRVFVDANSFAYDTLIWRMDSPYGPLNAIVPSLRFSDHPFR